MRQREQRADELHLQAEMIGGESGRLDFIDLIADK